MVVDKIRTREENNTGWALTQPVGGDVKLGDREAGVVSLTKIGSCSA